MDKCFCFEFFKKRSKDLKLQNLVLLEFRPVRCIRYASVRSVLAFANSAKSKISFKILCNFLQVQIRMGGGAPNAS